MSKTPKKKYDKRRKNIFAIQGERNSYSLRFVAVMELDMVWQEEQHESKEEIKVEKLISCLHFTTEFPTFFATFFCVHSFSSILRDYHELFLQLKHNAHTEQRAAWPSATTGPS